MQFNEYIKQCREHNHLTQEQLVHDLYSYDIDSFESLDTSTLSKWERGVTQPKLSRQVNILKYFQERTGVALPCLDNYKVEEAEGLISKVGMRNLIGKSKKLIYHFPSEMMSVDDMKVYPLRNFERMDVLIEAALQLQQSYTHEFMKISREQFKEWALRPENLFLTCEYKDAFLGLFFALRVKPEVFNKILNFEMKLSEISTDDFVEANEMGSGLIIAFFAMNEKAAILLFIRYYANLIANQKHIDEIGGIITEDEGKKIVTNMNLQFDTSKMTDDGMEIDAFRQTLSNVLASEKAVKMLLSKQECPEE